MTKSSWLALWTAALAITALAAGYDYISKPVPYCASDTDPGRNCIPYCPPDPKECD